MKKVGFYPGSFDPFTKGHMAVVCEALQLFDKVIIAVGNNSEKKTMFDASKRIEMIKSSIQDFKVTYLNRQLSGAKFSPAEEKVARQIYENLDGCIEVISYDGLTVDAAIKYEANCLIRGERMVGDHDAEMQLAMFNRELLNLRGSSMGIVFIPVPSTNLTYVSSGNVKNLCANGEYIVANKYVYPSVHKVLMEKYLEKRYKEQNFSLDKDEKWRSLVAQYADPSRTYHNLSHIAYCLNIIDIFMRKDRFSYREIAAVKSALFYHDIVIKECGAEEQSAEIAEKSLVADGKLLKSLIMSTKVGTQYEDIDLDVRHLVNLVHDADLAILADNENYGLYAQQVRLEYDVDTKDYAKGRIEVLEKIKTEMIYFSEFADRLHWQDKAEDNINREIAFWQTRL